MLRTFTILRLVAGTFACRLILGGLKRSSHLLESLQNNSGRLPNAGKTYSRIRHARVLLCWLAEHRMLAVSMRKRPYRLGAEVRTFAEATGGAVFATTSRRTGPQATVALKKGLGHCCYLHEWQPDQSENPYLAYLASADILIVTGESESMLAEAAATGKPVYIYPLPKQQLDLWTQLKEWIVARGEKQRLGHRGTIKPQRGLQYLCARLVERGIILPQPDLHILHETLVGSGIAQFFGSSLSPTSSAALREVDDIARRVRMLMGIVSRSERGKAD